MSRILLIAALLVAITVLVHTSGFALVLRFVVKPGDEGRLQAWPIAWRLIKVAWFLILVHGIEITIWALFYLWKGCLPDAESAFYFSGVTYTSIGYGDLVLPKPWRILGPVEGLTGILMCGLSAALFFALLTRVYSLRLEARQK
jgi:hypothetical protein